MLGNRSVKQILNAVVSRQHYIALANMARLYPRFCQNFIRYISGSGTYPYEAEVRSPVGIVKPRLYSHHDLLTVNEIFCRLDYPAEADLKVVVDIGSNIGISALYFLSRNAVSKCYLFEPDARNVVKLEQNLAAFTGRYVLSQKAVSSSAGKVEFGIEPTGRYGGIGVKSETIVTVDCLEINDVLRGILATEEYIDILKIDTEGTEISTVEAIQPDVLKRIKRIFIEAAPESLLHPDLFTQRQYGSIYQMFRK